MPFKSKAQRRKFAELLMNGEISPETFEEWNRETGSAKLPERVKSAKKPSSRHKAKSKGGASKSKAGSKRPSKRGGIGAVFIAFLCGCAASTQSSAAAEDSELDCSFRSPTTCWTVSGRFPAAASNPLDLYYMPYTHSLLAALLCRLELFSATDCSPGGAWSERPRS
jgi:hypothetical protein